MLRAFVKGVLGFRFLVVTIAAAFVFLGVAQLREMPVAALPEFSPVYVEIQTEALGLSAKEVEQLITVPMEQDLLIGVPWLDTIRSKSVPGMSSILLFFKPGTSLNQARQMVAERLTQAVALPHVSQPPTMLQPLSSTSRFMIVGLSSKDMSLIDMSVLTRWTIAPRLMSVPGVANVAVWGQRNRQLQVQIDPARLQAQGVSVQDVLETTGNALWVSSLSFLEASTPGTGGFIDTPNQRLGVWHVLPISSPKELAEVPIEDRAGLRLGDVANIVDGHQLLIGDAASKQGASLLLVIEKLPGTNILDVTHGVEEAINALRPGMKGIEFDTSLFRPATFVENTIDNLTRALAISFILGLVALGLLFFDWRVVLICIITIPVSLLAALFVIYQRGATLNVMVFAGLVAALGIVIDDAILDIDNMARRVRQRRQEGAALSIEAIVLEAALEVRGRIIFATLMLMLVLLPAFLLEGQSNAFFQPLALTYALALLASMVVALTLTPALGVIVLSIAPVNPRQGLLIPRLQQIYDRALQQVVQRSTLAYAAVAVLVIAGVAVSPFLGENLLPSFKERNVLIQLDSIAGTSLPEMNRIAARMSNELRAIPGVQNVGIHVGRAVMGDQIVGVNSGTLWISIDPAANYDTTLATVEDVVNGYPGLAAKVQTYLDKQSSAVIPSATDPVVVRVFGENLDILRPKADELRKAIAGISGVGDTRMALPIEEPTFEIEVNLATAQKYGIKPGDVRRAASIMVSGIQVGSLFEGQKVFDVVVWGVPNTRHSLSSVRDLPIDTPDGGHVRLGDVAEVRVTSVPNIIQREGASPFIDIGVNVQGRSVDAVVGDIQRTIKGMAFPLEYHAEILGESAKRDATTQRFLGALLVVLIGTFFLQQAVFQRWRLAVLSFLVLPWAVVGGLLAAFLIADRMLSLGALVGLITILGITLRNVVSLVGHYQHLEQVERQPFGLALVLRGSQERFGAIITTLLATGLAVVPFILLGDNPGNEIVRPMAIVILGGLVTSLVITLFVMPILYLRFGAGARTEPVAEPSPEPPSELMATS